MQIREVMNTDIQTVSPDALITDVAKMMKDGDFGVVPVCRQTDVIGMVTDRDIVVRAVAVARDIANCRVQDVMTTEEVVSCKETDDVEDVARLMSERQVRRIVVLDDAGKLTGIVSLGDLARESEHKAGQALGDISQPQHNEPTHAH